MFSTIVVGTDGSPTTRVAVLRAARQGNEVVTYAVAGDAAQRIVEVAESRGADLIVVGNKGMTGAKRLLGSVPNKVAHSAPCSVMIIHTT